VRSVVWSTHMSDVYSFPLKGNVAMVRQSRWYQRQGSQCA
jgi:hypothetical protein